MTLSLHILHLCISKAICNHVHVMCKQVNGQGQKTTLAERISAIGLQYKGLQGLQCKGLQYKLQCMIIVQATCVAERISPGKFLSFATCMVCEHNVLSIMTLHKVRMDPAVLLC